MTLTALARISTPLRILALPSFENLISLCAPRINEGVDTLLTALAAARRRDLDDVVDRQCIVPCFSGRDGGWSRRADWTFFFWAGDEKSRKARDELTKNSFWHSSHRLVAGLYIRSLSQWCPSLAEWNYVYINILLFPILIQQNRSIWWLTSPAPISMPTLRSSTTWRQEKRKRP